MDGYSPNPAFIILETITGGKMGDTIKDNLDTFIQGSLNLPVGFNGFEFYPRVHTGTFIRYFMKLPGSHIIP
jgi:hypothetical protein|tara:strand:+ start:19881 stop:20096 length:216 start_codon:yes stop_codon:yes gene_type:complete